MLRLTLAFDAENCVAPWFAATSTFTVYVPLRLYVTAVPAVGTPPDQLPGAEYNPPDVLFHTEAARTPEISNEQSSPTLPTARTARIIEKILLRSIDELISRGRVRPLAVPPQPLKRGGYRQWVLSH